MRVDVDEPRRDNQAPRIDFPTSGVSDPANRSNSISADAQIPFEPRIACTIHDSAVADNDVERFGTGEECDAAEPK